MSNDLNTNIPNYSQTPIPEAYEINGDHSTDQTSGTGSSSGVSTIEKSKYIPPSIIALMDFPLLNFPSDNNGDISKIAGVISTNANEFLVKQQLEMGKIVLSMLEKWGENIKEIAEDMRKYINSPEYQVLLDLKLKGDLKPAISQVSGSSPDGANLAPIVIENQMKIQDEIKKQIKIHNDDQNTSGTQNSDDGSKFLALSAIISFMAGGAIALGSIDISTTINGMSSAPMTGPVQLVERLQPLFPSLLQDIIPTINLMIMPLIYYTSFEASVGNVNNKDKKNSQAAAENFARDIIVMVSNPAFVKIPAVEKALANQNLTTEQRDQLAIMLKLILASVALSLLYSVQVGKVINGKFLGMEPQEFKGLLTGEIPIVETDKSKLTKSQQMQLTLVKLIKSQLDALPPEERIKALNILFDYLTTPNDMHHLLDVTKILPKVLSNEDLHKQDPTNTPV